MKQKHIALIGLIIFGLVVITIVSWHSVEEIHYLKEFFPHEFTVAEARDATIIEIIKVVFIAFPIILGMWLCLQLMQISRK